MIAREARAPSEARGGTKRYLRGTSLLLAGRGISVAGNFAVQVLAVRYLAKSDYGAFAWALAISSMAGSIVLLGLNRGVGRFTPIYLERREYSAMFGTMVLALGTVLGAGLAVVALVIGARGLVAQHVESGPSVGLLLILIGLTPVNALDTLLETLVATFVGARSVFFRKNVLGPALKLLAVLLVVVVRGSVRLLAVAYLVAGCIGIALYAAVLWQALARQGLLADPESRRMRFPARELFAFSVPLLTTDLLLVIETPLVVMVLEHFRSTIEVAELRAVAPVAGLCLIVYDVSKILFRPQAARLFGRNDEAGLGELYWRTAVWVAIATFPMFAAFLVLAEPLTLLLFGGRYAGSAVLLTILAVGTYFNAAMGVNTFTLQVYARVRMIVLINTGSAALGLGLCLLVVPRFGAIGAAAATTAAMVIRNVGCQAGLMVATPVGRIPRPALRAYASVVLVAGLLVALKAVAGGAAVMVPAVVLGALAVAWLNRGFLDVLDTFPELARIALLRRFLAAPAT